MKNIITRRSVFKGAVAIAAVPSAVHATTAPVTASPELLKLIDQHDQIYAVASSANARFEELIFHPDRPERPHLFLREVQKYAGDHLAHLDRPFFTVAVIDEYFSDWIALLTERINEDYPEDMSGMPGMHKRTRERFNKDWKAAKAELRKRLSVREQWDHSHGIPALEDETDQLYAQVCNLQDQIAAFPCASFQDVQAKADYLIRLHDQRGFLVGETLPFLMSMTTAKGGEL